MYTLVKLWSLFLENLLFPVFLFPYGGCSAGKPLLASHLMNAIALPRSHPWGPRPFIDYWQITGSHTRIVCNLVTIAQVMSSTNITYNQRLDIIEAPRLRLLTSTPESHAGPSCSRAHWGIWRGRSCITVQPTPPLPNPPFFKPCRCWSSRVLPNKFPVHTSPSQSLSLQGYI